MLENVLSFINFLDSSKGTTGTDFICGGDSKLLWIVQVLRLVIRVICIAAPFALIIFGSLDFFKAIIAGDEKEMKAKRKPFVGRLIAAVIILLMPTIVNLVMRTVAKNANSEFATCWTNAGSGTQITIPENNTNEWITN